MALSFDILGHAAVETARISWPAVAAARRGTLTPAFCDEKLRSWSARLLAKVEAEIVTTGQEHIRPEQSYVVISNHQSLYDIPALFVGLPLSLRMAAKAELFKTPLWGQAMHDAGFIRIDRKNPRDAYRALDQGAERLRKDGTSLHIAPEGTRSSDGHVAEFKRGAFRIAARMKLPLLPVVIDGTKDIHPKGSNRVYRGKTVRLTVLPAIAPEQFGSLDELRVRVRQQIASELAKDAARS